MNNENIDPRHHRKCHPKKGGIPSLMAELSIFRRLIKLIHPEGIPAAGVRIYNTLSQTRMFRHHYVKIAEDIARYCGPQGSALDVGTGPAWLLVELHRLRPQMILHGVDISPAMVAGARKNLARAGLAGAIDIHEAGAGHLPFADCSFDVVASTGSIHHWKDPTGGLNEVWRALKPGGYGLMYDIVSNTPRPVWADMMRQFGRLRMTLLWVHAFEEPFYTMEAYGSLARPTRFREGKLRFVGVMCCLVMKKEE